LHLASRADVMVEGFRPGVAERLGIGPDACRARNPRLVYGRMTGWGQEGPMARDVGHDINYISLTGVLASIGERGGPPVPPLNLIGDFGGGSMLLVIGILAALVERSSSGAGQVVDAAMIDGSSLLMAAFYAADQGGGWGPRGTNVLDGGAPFYGVYECADGEYVSVAAMEPQFYAAFCKLLALDDLDPARQYDRALWPELRDRITAIFRSKTRAEWLAVMQGHEVCFAPVLSMSEARRHEHNVARGTYATVDGVEQPAPAPRFSRTPAAVAHSARPAGSDTDAAFADWEIPPEEISRLRDAGAIA
jgi:alpha-methylacyl-CoA racemase